MTIKILEEISSLLPSNAEITTMAFEGANIILYTKNKEFFLNNTNIIREIVSTIKKRVELRPDPSLPLNLEKAEIEIRKILPEEAGKQNLIFDPQRSQVIIEVEKPGMAIGKAGEVLKQIKEKTLWVPVIRRIPSIRSQIIENIRQVLYENNDYRKKFLNQVGERIYGPKRRNKKTEWVRITCLGAGRQVGRSCFLLQTPESNILLDCGQNVAAPEEHAYPYFDAPELKIEELDAVIISHAHVDHCLAPESQVLLKEGAYKSIEEVKEGDQLMTVNWEKGKLEPGICVAKTKTNGHKKINIIKTPYSEIEASPNHRFFTIENLQLKEIESQDLKINDLIPLSNLKGGDKEKGGFSSLAKQERLVAIARKSVFKEDLIPMSSKDIKKLLKDTRIVGTAHNGLRFNDLPSSIIDWYGRDLNSYATRDTVKTLLNVLEHRAIQLYHLKSSSKVTIREIRQNLNLSQAKLSQDLGISLMQVQYREEGYIDAITELLESYILKELELTIVKTEEYITKIKQILAIPVTWSRIVSIENKDNPHDHLVDIEVLPNRNFIANGNVVHNSSLVPLLFKYGYKGPVYCTPPTRDISALLALDIIAIAQKDARKALYSSTEIKDMVKHTITLDYEEVTDITPDVRLTFYDAGHILGSALVHLHIGEGVHNLCYTGDFNYELSNLLAPASTQFPRLETLMLECTYGTKDETSMSRQEAEDYVIEVVQRTLQRGGKILFPVLGVGRSQELMVIFERLMREGIINKVPMYVQGLVWDINAIHTAYPDFYNNKMKKQIFHQGINPFTSDVFKQIGSRKEMQEIMDSGDPCIILATSGMLTGGASVEYFKMLCENPKHSLILTSYQGEGSLGRRLENGEKEMGFMVGENKQEILKVNMEIHSVHGFTGHSNYKQLIGYIKNVQPRPKKVIFIHGESSRCLEMSSTVHKMFKIETLAPKNLETIRLR